MNSRITRITRVPEGEPIFSERATEVEIADEAAGEFVTVFQSTDDGENKIVIDPTEWQDIRKAIDDMMGAINVLA